MARRSLLISLSVACLSAALLWSSLSYASEILPAGAHDGRTGAGAQPQNEILRAFTRELAFIRTFAVSAPAQYEQKGQGIGPVAQGNATGRISEEEIQPREYRSGEAAKTEVSSGAIPVKKKKGRKK